MRYTDLLGVCDICAQKNPDKKHDRQHMDKYGQFLCMFCPKQEKFRQKMIRHIESHTKIQFECTLCDFKTYYFNAFIKHAIKLHRRFGCNLCDERRKTKTEMEQHLATKFHNPPKD